MYSTLYHKNLKCTIQNKIHILLNFYIIYSKQPCSVHIKSGASIFRLFSLSCGNFFMYKRKAPLSQQLCQGAAYEYRKAASHNRRNKDKALKKRLILKAQHRPYPLPHKIMLVYCINSQSS